MLRPSLSVWHVRPAASTPLRGVAGVYAPAFVERGDNWQIIEGAEQVSPEFMLRPSLSVRYRSRPRIALRRRVAGVYAPAFVERARAWGHSRASMKRVSPEFMLRPSLSEGNCDSVVIHLGGSVAGVYAPAFVERIRPSRKAFRSARHVSPEFMLRPSLSAALSWAGSCMAGGVAGVYAPAFVERRLPRQLRNSRRGRVSPEFMLRPSLSERRPRILHPSGVDRVSPEFMLRPSLSVRRAGGRARHSDVSPEFMLRPSLSDPNPQIVPREAQAGVAGVYAPAFVERRQCRKWPRAGPASVAGVYAPAFVERTRIRGRSRTGPWRCRRSLCSGLR